MRSLKLFAVAALAMFALAATVVSSASGALPRNLPEIATARAQTGEAVGTSTFETLSKLKVECKKAESTGTEESKKPLGTFDIHFKECSGVILGIRSTCTGLGETSGIILVTGTWHLVFDELTPALKTAILFLINPVHFECASGATLVLVEGTELCLHTNPTEENTTHEFKCEQSGGENSVDTQWFNEAGTSQSFGLLTSTNGATKEKSAELATGKVTTTEKVKADQ